MYIEVFPHKIASGMVMSDSYIMVLDAPEVKKQVPVLIGSGEAEAFILALEDKDVRRPLTHVLFNKVMEEFMLELKKVTIDRFEEGVFYATLHVSDGFAEKQIDSRTSDAITLAVLQQCPILMDMNVLNETCMEPGALEGNLPDNDVVVEDSLEELEAKLHECEVNEDYEQAAEIMKLIDELKKR